MRKTGNFSPLTKQEILKIQKSRKFLSHSNQENLKVRKTGNFSPLTKQEILKVRKTGNFLPFKFRKNSK